MNGSLQRSGRELHFYTPQASTSQGQNAQRFGSGWRSANRPVAFPGERAENEQLYKTDLPEADIPPDVLIALLGIKDMQGDYE